MDERDGTFGRWAWQKFKFFWQIKYRLHVFVYWTKLQNIGKLEQLNDCGFQERKNGNEYNAMQRYEHEKSFMSWLVWLLFLHVKCSNGCAKEYQYDGGGKNR